MLESELHLDEAVQKDMRYISDRMREIRENYGESQMDFDETLQLSRSTVARQESGLADLSMDYLLRLLRATKTPAECLLPPDLTGGADKLEKLYAKLNEDNKYTVQNAVKNMLLDMLSAQKQIGRRML